MLDIVSLDIMGVKTWVKTSNMLRRLHWGHRKLNRQDTEQHHEVASTSEVSRGTRAETHVPAARKRTIQKLPVAVKILDHPGSVDQQLASPLFAKLPAEIRELIWDYALTQYEDFDRLYPLNMPYTRPGQAAPSRIDLDLLLTCRAIYLETFLVPFQVNPITVFDGHPDVVPPDMPLQCTPWNLRLCSKLRPWQFANISSVDMNVQQFMLEGGSIERVSRLTGNKGRHEGHEARGFTLAGYASFGAAKETKAPGSELVLRPGAAETRAALVGSIFKGKKITHLTLRLSHSDWWSWTSTPQAGSHDPHEALRLEPMINVTDRRDTSAAMLAGYEARKEGREPDFGLDEFEKQGRWGMQFEEYWPDIQTLELVLETYAAKERQLDTVVECAKLWTFPLCDGKQLQWDGREKPGVRWRGGHKYRSDAEIGMAWANDGFDERGVRDEDDVFTGWHPDVDKENGERPGQEFVMKSLAFRRQRGASMS
ncbi:hypothetical protein F4861DRAFT_486355 [Xylaria intraflava]|nr:hypothetical protein F4861DRAFT_486355 [Xylaria intraflava]